MNNSPPRYFQELLLNPTIQRNLDILKFSKLTAIQSYVIPELMARNNVFGLARVGSGKTLSFLIPIIQHLSEQKWNMKDGLGALIITPTRELGMQIFQVLNQVAKNLRLSCGMICGGHKVEQERKSLDQMNILIATPGRLNQHLLEFRGTLGDNLQWLIFDEVDMILEQGFLKQVKEIIDYFPQAHMRGDQLSRVSAFFSATESPKVQQLLKYCFSQNLTLVPREINETFINQKINTTQKVELLTQKGKQQYVPPHNPNPLLNIIKICTSSSLQQTNLTSIVTQIHPADKVDTLFSFMRSFPQTKAVVFFSTCNQTSFVFDAFRKLNVGAHLIKLTSKMSQAQRSEAFFEFKNTKNGYLLTTDVAARGMDIRDISFVLQFDCPNDVRDFIHRAGRCTRMLNKGTNILFLASNENFKENLVKNVIKFEEKFVKLKNAVSVRQALSLLLASDPTLKQSAERAVKSYYKSLICAKKLEGYDFTQIARSYGLEVDVLQNEESSASEEQEEDVLTVKTQGRIEQEEKKTEAQPKLNAEQLTKMHEQRINKIQMKVGKDDLQDRKEHNKIIRNIKHGVSDDEEQSEEQNEEELSVEAQLEGGEEFLEYGEENGEEYGEDFEEWGEEEEVEDLEWQEPGKV
ncbi:ATP-dependent_RNA helicase [Hexamita inflata]|uniref:ATP-dependent RNA helicase n=1 Tax=Hexamita inflata TaxID=28002 RepID=A0AA86NYH3_9EUKA|nr:ATP-dependent RNA helicase [Hexamita inflata]